MDIETSRQNNEDVMVVVAWRQQKLAFCDVPTIASSKERLYVVQRYALEQFKAVEERVFVFRIDG